MEKDPRFSFNIFFHGGKNEKRKKNKAEMYFMLMLSKIYGITFASVQSVIQKDEIGG